ncbi:MAG TPA: hypothetical protein VFO74_03745 [Pseudolabrys sp.]|nr:hypothetical protein [Pseudolabrys sp.]
MGIGDHLARQRQQGETRGIDFPNHAAEIELEIGFKLARQLLHAPVVGETVHPQQFDPTIARTQKRALEQDGANAMTLPGQLDAESGFTLAREHGANRAKLGGAPQDTVNKKAMQHHAEAARRACVPRDGLIRNRARKAPVAAFAIETEQVVTIGVGFAGPQFADYAAIGQRLIHIGSPQKMVALAWQCFQRLGGS